MDTKRGNDVEATSLYRALGVVIPIMENQLETCMENDMNAGSWIFWHENFEFKH